MLCSCNRNDDEPATEITLPIAEEYLPVTVRFNSDDKEWIEKTKGWSDKKLVIDDASAMPDDDPLGFSDAYKGIDFSRYTLLMTYHVRPYSIETYRNRYYRNTAERTYNWVINIKTADFSDDKYETWYFSRYAVLVRKIPDGSDVRIWYALSLINGGWE